MALPDLTHPHTQRASILIVGGGVMGAALAYWLTRLRPDQSVVIVERDPRYEHASSSRSASSIRQQFSCPVNVALSRFGFDFLKNATAHLSLTGEPVELSVHEGGYLYLADSSQRSGLERIHAVQTALGAAIALLDPAELAQRFPWLQVDDLALGALGLSGEGWFDGPALHQAFLARAIAQGARRIVGSVTSVAVQDGRVRGVALADQRTIHCDQMVIAAGAWSAPLADMAGDSIAVHASRRTVFVISCPEPLPDCPLLIDPSGFWLRPEGRFLLTGAPPLETTDDLPMEPDWRELGEDQWARLAHRIPALAAMRIERAWAGYYEMHGFDHNALIGPSASVDGLWYLCGFSGHGMQHAPGAGLALAEWLTTGAPRTIDVRPLEPARVPRGEPLTELNVIG